MKFKIGDQVLMNKVNLTGTVISIIDQSHTLYQVQYTLSGDLRTKYLYEEELTLIGNA